MSAVTTTTSPATRGAYESVVDLLLAAQAGAEQRLADALATSRG